MLSYNNLHKEYKNLKIKYDKLFDETYPLLKNIKNQKEKNLLLTQKLEVAKEKK